MKVKMHPHVTRLGKGTSGIARVVEGYFAHLPKFGIELVDQDATTYDLEAAHAGMTGADCDVCHCHGLYWTEDYDAPAWEFRTNRKVIEAVRSAKAVTVPSPWVAEAFQRDMHLSPHVVPHGIDWEAWQSDTERNSFVLWNKNRQADVCDVTPAIELAKQCPDTNFVSTFEGQEDLSNVLKTDVIPFHTMKRLVQRAGIYLSTTKETWGIGILEAMASGVPILGYAHGGILDLVEHGVNGYLAEPGNLEDLEHGLRYCQRYNKTLGSNGKSMARQWTWENACKRVAAIYRKALQPDPPTVAIIIPTYNYANFVGNAIESAIDQTYPHVKDIIVVNDGSTDDTDAAIEPWLERDQRITYIKQENSGVAIARNKGIAATDAKYVCCLDADDRIKPNFVASLVPELESDKSLGAAYSSLIFVTEERSWVHNWPDDYDYDEQAIGLNQIPTCCLFRRDLWERLGGYRQRYAPKGCGAEDAEFWLRMGAIGYGGTHVDKPLFLYSAGGYTFSDPTYTEPNWLDWHPWVFDHRHPFASVATPHDDSHPVRQYDEPTVSVIIPIGPGHERTVIDALDSLEAQTFRKWEAIAILDGTDPRHTEYLTKAYPFVKWIHNNAPTGAGAARNQGTAIARAPLLLFLDADDWLLPHSLEAFLRAYGSLPYEAVIYSDSLGLKRVSEERAKQYRKDEELISYDDGTAIIKQTVAEYDHDLAVQQPNTAEPYFWCYITSLHPASWHHEIGGFDPELPAWEDWDYWIRMAKAGKPFIPVDQELMVYSYEDGQRRRHGQTIKKSLWQELRRKHEEVDIMACKNCGRKTIIPRTNTRRRIPNRSMPQSRGVLSDDDFVLCRYVRPKRGAHSLMGVTTFRSPVEGFRMRQTTEGWVLDYGYHSQGDEFLVHISDQQQLSMWFQIIEERDIAHSVPLPTRAKPEPKPPERLQETETEPEPIEFPFDLQTLPGITPALASALEEADLDTPEAIIEGGTQALKAIKGIGSVKADVILAAAEDTTHTEPEDEDDILTELEKMLA